MNRAPGLPLFVTVSVLVHGMAALAWHSPGPPVMHIGSALQVSLLPQHERRMRQSESGTQAGLPRETAPHSSLLPSSRSARAPLHASRTAVARPVVGKAGAAARPMPAEVAVHAEGRELQRRITRVLAQYFYYPPVAIRFGWQGTVRIGLQVDRNGSISKIRLLHSSGYAVLDAAALHSTRRIHSVGGLGNTPRTDHFDLQVPVVYRLAEG